MTFGRSPNSRTCNKRILLSRARARYCPISSKDAVRTHFLPSYSDQTRDFSFFQKRESPFPALTSCVVQIVVKALSGRGTCLTSCVVSRARKGFLLTVLSTHIPSSPTAPAGVLPIAVFFTSSHLSPSNVRYRPSEKKYNLSFTGETEAKDGISTGPDNALPSNVSSVVLSAGGFSREAPLKSTRLERMKSLLFTPMTFSVHEKSGKILNIVNGEKNMSANMST